MKSIKILIIVTFVAFVSVSCSTTKIATQSAPPDVSAKLVTIPEGKSAIYIVRPAALGFAIKFKVWVDDVLIGSTSGTNYIYAIVDPGEHEILSEAENDEKLKLTTEVQKNSFVEQIPTMGVIMARNKLVLLDETTGKTKLAKCKLPSSFKK